MATSDAINFSNVENPIPAVEGVVDIYEVPALKVAKVTLNFVHMAPQILTSDNGNFLRLDLTLYLGNSEIYLNYSKNSTSQNLNGGIHETSDLKAGASFWTIDGEFIKPRESPVYFQAASTFEEFTRASGGSSNKLRAPRKVPRVIYLKAGEKIRYSAVMTDGLTVTSSQIAVAVLGDVVLEDA